MARTAQARRRRDRRALGCDRRAGTRRSRRPYRLSCTATLRTRRRRSSSRPRRTTACAVPSPRFRTRPRPETASASPQRVRRLEIASGGDRQRAKSTVSCLLVQCSRAQLSLVSPDAYAHYAAVLDQIQDEWGFVMDDDVRAPRDDRFATDRRAVQSRRPRPFAARRLVCGKGPRLLPPNKAAARAIAQEHCRQCVALPALHSNLTEKLRRTLPGVRSSSSSPLRTRQLHVHHPDTDC